VKLQENRIFPVIKIMPVLLPIDLRKGYGIVYLGDKVFKSVLHQDKGFFPVSDVIFPERPKGKIKIKKLSQIIKGREIPCLFTLIL